MEQNKYVAEIAPQVVEALRLQEKMRFKMGLVEIALKDMSEVLAAKAATEQEVMTEAISKELESETSIKAQCQEKRMAMAQLNA